MTYYSPSLFFKYIRATIRTTIRATIRTTNILINTDVFQDRSYGGPVIVASPDGGVDIEEVGY